MTFIAACMQCIYCCMHACIEVCVVSHITIGFIIKPIVMDTISVDFVLKPAVISLPPNKKEPGTYTRMHPHFTLISQFHILSLLTLFTLRDLVMAPGYFIAGLYMFSSLTLQLCIYASSINIYLVCDILLGIFYIMQYIFSYLYFLNFIKYNAIYILLFHILAMYIYASIYIYLVCYILLGTFYIMKYIFIIIFLEFYQVG